ncbi:TetR/AcrR family transcriptional regulator [Paenibacillus filicis]|uniref:TetR/AcrR family transcriptional regulator n=1 Tax=Paenibacillus gyeongsangnamensis TaxID=3388067 RepID=A0ABT4QFA3_9BACL|nr:TetR/AcrR family transcriptional regulator [Paenibacillus filicis]MCZ8515534.1 TetR/AcrR family transcriptional regulator [Paenibacillus filicis]
MSAQTIKAAALRLFAGSGYDGVPLSEIAKEVGIKTPSLYAHFTSKDDLFMAVFEDVLAEHAERLEDLMRRLEGRSVEERLHTILHDTCHTYLLSENHVTFLKRTMLFPPAALKEKLLERFEESEKRLNVLLKQIFQDGLRSGHLRTAESADDLVMSFYCLLDGMFIQQFYYRPDDWEHRLQTVWRIYWQGLAAK